MEEGQVDKSTRNFDFFPCDPKPLIRVTDYLSTDRESMVRWLLSLHGNSIYCFALPIKPLIDATQSGLRTEEDPFDTVKGT